MIWCQTECSARLMATKKMTEDWVKSVTVNYNEEKEKWCVEYNFFSEEEQKIIMKTYL